MLDWMGSEGDAIRIAFSKVFGTGYRPFGARLFNSAASATATTAYSGTSPMTRGMDGAGWA